MKNYLKILLIALLIIPFDSSAQTTDAKALTVEGNELAKQKDYAGAIAKYKAALSADPDYAPGNYQMAFALVMTNKGLDGIPYLEKVFKSKDVSVKLLGGAYNLAGSIYDQNKQAKKAIAVYKEGVDSLSKKETGTAGRQQLEYNLGLAYFRDKQYSQAKLHSEVSIALDSSHASSQRLYALVSFHLNMRAPALLGFCSFIMLEGATPRSVEAFGNIQNIMAGGVLKPESGQKRIVNDAETIKLNKAIADALKPFALRRYASSGDLLADQLKALFVGFDRYADFVCWGGVLRNGFVNYFYKLSQTPHMPAFARLISQTKPESAAWIKAHPQEMADLNNWIKTTKRW